MSAGGGFTLESLVSGLRAVGAKDFGEKIAAESVPEVQKRISDTLAAGETPSGTAWGAKKRDGGRAYPNAASKIDTKSFGNVVRTTLTGNEVYGHFGSAKMQRRQMLPDAGAGLPPEIEKALTIAAEKVLARTLGGAR